MLTSESLEIENIATDIRARLGIADVEFVDAVTLLIKLKLLIPGFHYARVANGSIPGIAQWNSTKNTISIVEDTFCKANFPNYGANGRFAIAHEVVHAMEKHTGSLNRLNVGDRIPNYARKLRNLESRTDKITAAVLIPAKFVTFSGTIEELAFQFGVSKTVARIRLEHLGHLAKHPRQRPIFVDSLLRDLKEDADKSDTPQQQYEDQSCLSCRSKKVIKIGVRFLCKSCGDDFLPEGSK